MNQNLINPFIRKAKYSVLVNPNTIRTRSIFDYELVYIMNGEFMLEYDSIEYRIKKGTFLLIHPGVEHMFRSLGEPIEQPHIHFDLQFDEYSQIIPISFKSIKKMSVNEQHLIRKDELTFLDRSPIIVVSDPTAFLKHFFSLINEFSRNGNRSTLSVRAEMMHLLNIIFNDNNHPDAGRKEATSSHSQMEEVKNFIDANYQSKITLKTLQYLFYYSKASLEKHFCEQYRIPIMHYCKQVKLEKSKKMLKTESVTKVAKKLSFSSINAFSRAFRNTFGMSPQEYQRFLEKQPELPDQEAPAVKKPTR